MIDTTREGADIRVHVGVVARTVYVFDPHVALARAKAADLQIVTAGQPGVAGPTATGYRVPLQMLRPELRERYYPGWVGWAGFDRTLPTSEKGRRAQSLVEFLLAHGEFPIVITPEIVQDKARQIAGIDLIVSVQKAIQVKCDFRAGSDGCGVFLQLTERNPLGRI